MAGNFLSPFLIYQQLLYATAAVALHTVILENFSLKE